MAEWVALASVVSSGLVALGGLWLTYRTGHEQRKHEADLAYEERAWETKSEGLFKVIAAARVLVDTLSDPNEHGRNTIGLVAFAVRDSLEEEVPLVEAYASADCVKAFHALRDLLRAAEQDHTAETKIAKLRRIKEEAISAKNFEEAAQMRDAERSTFRRATERMGIDLQDLSNRAEVLLVAARASVRGEGG